ncbi:MAG: tandem-95 repeat protein, partial [Sphingobacteriales bacterium]
NDTDPDGDVLSISSVQDATHGTVSLSGANVTFTPDANYNGPASFNYTISDGKGGVSTATVSLVVTPVNDAPIAVNDSVSTRVGSALTVAASTLLANDSDIEKDSFAITSVQNPVNGTVSLSGTNIIFTPTAGYEGQGSFTYNVTDSQGGTRAATVNVAIGTAMAPSVVVEKSIIAIAHGSTTAATVSFPIITALVDTDGSESLSIKVTGLPSGSSFNNGSYDSATSSWNFAPADLSNLMLTLPAPPSMAPGAAGLLCSASKRQEISGS